LLKSELKQIIDIQLKQVEKMLAEKNIGFLVEDDAKELLLQRGYDVTYGARPLKRNIQKFIINPLSAELLMNKFESGNTIIVHSSDEGKFVFIKK